MLCVQQTAAEEKQVKTNTLLSQPRSATIKRVTVYRSPQGIRGASVVEEDTPLHFLPQERQRRESRLKSLLATSSGHVLCCSGCAVQLLSRMFPFDLAGRRNRPTSGTASLPFVYSVPSTPCMSCFLWLTKMLPPHPPRQLC